MESSSNPVPLELKSEEQLNELLAKATGKIVVLNFYAVWAEPCVRMNQVFNALAEQSAGKSLFISIDAESETLAGLTDTYGVGSVPHFVLVRGDTVLERVQTADPGALFRALGKYQGTGATLPPPQKTTAPAAEEPPETVEHINERLEKLVKAAPVMLFMKGTPATPECGFSRRMVSLLREHGIRYGFFNILADDEVRQGLKDFSDWPTYPQLYCHGTLIGGLDIVKEEFEIDPNFLENMIGQTANEETSNA